VKNSVQDPPLRHHNSALDVARASREGCCICQKLWEQGRLLLPERADHLDHDAEQYANTTYTEFDIEPVHDRVDITWPESDTDPPIETLRSTGEWYKLSLRWHDEPDIPISYHLRASAGLSPVPAAAAAAVTARGKMSLG